MIKGGLLIAIGSAAPLLVVVYLHPAVDPIGFGMLAMLGVPIGLALIVTGILRQAVRRHADWN
jgi:hypothetical protein